MRWHLWKKGEAPPGSGSWGHGSIAGETVVAAYDDVAVGTGTGDRD